MLEVGGKVARTGDRPVATSTAYVKDDPKRDKGLLYLEPGSSIKRGRAIAGSKKIERQRAHGRDGAEVITRWIIHVPFSGKPGHQCTHTQREFDAQNQ